MSKSVAVEINDSGTAIGYATTGNAASVAAHTRPVRRDSGGAAVTVLGGLSDRADANATVAAVNAAGTIAGEADKFDAAGNRLVPRAVRWDSGSAAAVELASPAGSRSDATSVAYAINAAGQIAGYCDVLTFPFEIQHAVLWDAAGVPLDLNTLIDPASGCTLSVATGISDSGWVTGYGTRPSAPGSTSGTTEQFLIHVPEPATLATLGVAGLLLRRRGTVGRVERKQT